MTRKRPPSYYRYRETHSTIQITLTDSLKAIIDEKRGTRSYGEYVKKIIHDANPSENEKQELYDQGKKEGYSIGLDEGIERGTDVGYEKGKLEGYDEGFQKGYEQGLKEGHKKGRDETIEAIQNMNKEGTLKISIPD